MTNETKICPYCGKEVLQISKKCKHCKQWFYEQNNETTVDIPPKKCRDEKKHTYEPQAESTTIENNEKECPYCCQKVPFKARKCPHCGEWIIPKNESKTESKENGVSSLFYGLYGLVLIFIDLAIASALWQSSPIISIFAFIAILIIGYFLFDLYMLPSNIAINRNHPHRSAIVIFNFFFGGTIVMWFVALIWAYMGGNND